MVENWQPAIGSEGRSPLLKNDSSGAKKCPDRSRQTHTYTKRAAAKVMKLCSSTSLDSAQVITVQSRLSWYSEDWTGYFRMFDTSAKWGQSAHSIESSNVLSLGAWVTIVCYQSHMCSDVDYTVAQLRISYKSPQAQCSILHHIKIVFLPMLIVHPN